VVPIARSLAALLVLAGCASPAPLGPHGLPDKTFELPPPGPCTLPLSASFVDATLRRLTAVIGRYPPKYVDEAHREATYAEWSAFLQCAEAIPADRDPEKRFYLLAELYRQGHNMDVVGAAEKAASNLDACLQAYPRSIACNATASYFYLSIQPTPESLAIAERSLTVLREESLPELSEDAEAGFVFLRLYERDPAATRAQIDRYLAHFPVGERADAFRKIREHLGDRIEYREYEVP
jgi:hypothetical protein